MQVMVSTFGKVFYCFLLEREYGPNSQPNISIMLVVRDETLLNKLLDAVKNNPISYYTIKAGFEKEGEDYLKGKYGVTEYIFVTRKLYITD